MKKRLKRWFDTRWRGWWTSKLMPFWCGILGFPYFCPFEDTDEYPGGLW